MNVCKISLNVSKKKNTTDLHQLIVDCFSSGIKNYDERCKEIYKDFSDSFKAIFVEEFFLAYRSNVDGIAYYLFKNNDDSSASCNTIDVVFKTSNMNIGAAIKVVVGNIKKQLASVDVVATESSEKQIFFYLNDDGAVIYPDIEIRATYGSRAFSTIEIVAYSILSVIVICSVFLMFVADKHNDSNLYSASLTCLLAILIPLLFEIVNKLKNGGGVSIKEFISWFRRDKKIKPASAAFDSNSSEKIDDPEV